MKKQQMNSEKLDQKTKQNYRSPGQTERKIKNKRRYLEEEQMSTLLQNCERIIKEQEEYIEKLQKDNERKQSIIGSLLLKKQSTNGNMKLKKSQFEEQRQISWEQIEKLSKKLIELQNKYQLTAIQKQNIQKQIKAKDKQINELRILLRNQKERQIQQNEEIQQYIRSATQLKLAYQAKISKLLAEIRKKVENDVQNSKQKSFQPQTYSQTQQIRRLETPIKNKMNQNQFDSQYDQNDRSRQKTVRNIRKNWTRPTQSTQKLKLMNTPYKMSSNLIASNYKMFQSEILTKKKDLVNQKMLNQIEDVQFMSDNESSLEQEKSSTQVDTSGFEDMSKRKQDGTKRLGQEKISVQNIIKEFSRYYKQQANETQKIEDKNEVKMIHKSQKNLKKMKVQEILNNLSIKMKKFEHQSIYDI